MFVPHLLKELKATAAVGDPSDPDYRAARPARTFDRPDPKVLPIPREQNELVVKGMSLIFQQRWSVDMMQGRC